MIRRRRIRSAAATADATVSAADSWFAAGQGYPIADRNRHANLLRHSDGAAGSCRICHTGDGWRPLTGHRRRTDGCRRHQSQRGRNIHALCTDPIAAALYGCFFSLIGQNGFMLISFTDTQSDPSFLKSLPVQRRSTLHLMLYRAQLLPIFYLLY